MNDEINELKALKAEIEASGNALALAHAVARVMDVLIKGLELAQTTIDEMTNPPCQDCGHPDMHPDDLPDAGALAPQNEVVRAVAAASGELPADEQGGA